MKGTQGDPEVFLVHFCLKFSCHLRTECEVLWTAWFWGIFEKVFQKLFEKISPAYPYSCKWSRDQYSYKWNLISENFWLISVSYESMHLVFPGWLLCRLQAKWTIIWLLLNFWYVPCSPQSVDVSYITCSAFKSFVETGSTKHLGKLPKGKLTYISVGISKFIYQPQG